jgi:hypothetical protein
MSLLMSHIVWDMTLSSMSLLGTLRRNLVSHFYSLDEFYSMN